MPQEVWSTEIFNFKSDDGLVINYRVLILKMASLFLSSARGSQPLGLGAISQILVAFTTNVPT
jgi:hypothetical protein